MRLDLGLQSSRHHRSKALDEIYKMVAGSRVGRGVEAALAADNAWRTGMFDVFKILTFFHFFEKCSRPVQNVCFDVLILI